jgi:hypothetical protein
LFTNSGVRFWKEERYLSRNLFQASGKMMFPLDAWDPLNEFMVRRNFIVFLWGFL